MYKAAKYGEENLRFEFDKVNVFILNILMVILRTTKLAYFKCYEDIVRIAIIKNRVHFDY